MHTLSTQPLTRIPPSFFFLSYLQHFPSLAFCRRKRSKQNTFLFFVYLRRFRFHRHHDLIKSPDWLVIVPWRQNWEKTFFDWIISTYTMPPPTFHPPPTHVSISLFFSLLFFSFFDSFTWTSLDFSLSLSPLPFSPPFYFTLSLSFFYFYFVGVLSLLLLSLLQETFLISLSSHPFKCFFVFFLLIFTRYKVWELPNVESYFW